MDHLWHRVIGFSPRNSMFLLNLSKFFDIHKDFYALTTHSAKKYLPSFVFNMATFTSFLYCVTEISFQVRVTKKLLWISGCFPLKKRNFIWMYKSKKFLPIFWMQISECLKKSNVPMDKVLWTRSLWSNFTEEQMVMNCGAFYKFMSLQICKFEYHR